MIWTCQASSKDEKNWSFTLPSEEQYHEMDLVIDAAAWCPEAEYLVTTKWDLAAESYSWPKD